MRHSQRSLRHIQSTDTVRGWNPESDSIVLRNSKLRVAVHRVVWHEGDKVFYDQPLIVEPSGAISLPVDRKSGKIGLIQAQRPLARDLEAYNELVPDLDPANLGVITWESPRGLPKIGKTEQQTAEEEAEEESRGRVVSIEQLPIRAALNSTYFPQTVGCYVVEVDMSKPARIDDPLEGIIGKAQFFSLREFVELQEQGECVDVATGYIVNYLCIRHPGMLS